MKKRLLAGILGPVQWQEIASNQGYVEFVQVTDKPGGFLLKIEGLNQLVHKKWWDLQAGWVSVLMNELVWDIGILTPLSLQAFFFLDWLYHFEPCIYKGRSYHWSSTLIESSLVTCHSWVNHLLFQCSSSLALFSSQVELLFFARWTFSLFCSQVWYQRTRPGGIMLLPALILHWLITSAP